MATDNKYDRQLRLWGAHGQKALMEANILLLGAGPTGTETLKNLVLPGVGNITIVDDRVVTEDDCKDNFFVTQAHLGQPLAKVTQELLVELNPDVTGRHRVQAPADLLSRTDTIAEFSLVIATQLTTAQALELDTACRAAGVPLVLVRTFGLIGSCRVSAGEHAVVESKPDNVRPDWRLAEPFAEMKEFADEFKLEELDSHHHGHVPYPVLLLHLRKAWEAEGNTRPKSFREKRAFQAFIKAKGLPEYMNYEEAHEFAYVVCNDTEISRDVKEVLAAARARELTADAGAFWITARAVADFVDNEGAGLLPICADLADVTSTTAWYIRLQRIYAKKASEHCACIKTRVAALVKSLGADAVPDAFVELFCKNARFIRALKYRSIAEETAADTARREEILEHLSYGAGEMEPMLWYLMLRAVDRFHAKNGYFPGTDAEQADADAVKLSTEAVTLCGELDVSADAVSMAHCKEMCRYAGCEPHNVAAFMGGVASQEVVKLITRQYVPLNNTYVYNAISSNGNQFEL